MKKKIVLGVSVVLLSLMITSCFLRQDDEESMQTDQVAASSETMEALAGSTDYTQIVSSAVPVERKPLQSTVYASGIVRGATEAVVKANSPGTIKSIDFELGQIIEEGDHLLTVENTAETFSVQQLEKQVENSRALVEVNEKLYEKGAISLSELNTGRSTLSGLEAQLTRARSSLRDTFITSPISGRVGEKDSTLVIGDTVRSGQIIARIVDLERLRITLSLGQSQIFMVREGYDALITIDTPQKEYTVNGIVKAISAASDESTGSWSVIIDFDNPDSSIIRAGMSVDVSIIDENAPEYLIVPNAAMVYRNDKTYVYRLNDTSAQLVEINIIDTYGDNTAIEVIDAEFDLENEKVLISGLSQVQDGSPVVADH
ncbi:MAG: efflux RND transporter periplasmic adaptor subunit [Sphaerochaetaceae bacterium]